MPYLFQLNISPVQSFISQARKTQDLYAGSLILSDLMEKAKTVIDKETSGRVIFPTTSGSSSSSNPNRLIARIDKIEEKELSNWGYRIEKAIRDEFKSFAQNRILEKSEYKEKFEAFKQSNAQWFKQFYAQIENHLEIYWVFVAIENDAYAEAFAELEKQMAGVKNIRPFRQSSEIGRKCNIDGVNNALFYRPNINNKTPLYLDNGVLINEKVEFFCGKKPNPKKALRMGEGLSAISMLKRHYIRTSERGFPSTARISLLYGLNALEKAGVESEKEALNKIRDLDDQILYEENASVEQIKLAIMQEFEDLEGESLKKKVDEICNYRQDIVKAFKREKLRFDKYYAILRFDGDKMGEWMSGKILGQGDAGVFIDPQRLEKYHQTLSENLAAFADWAKQYVEGKASLDKDGKIESVLNKQLLSTYHICKGKPVYAGGDDFLGFINLHYLFDTMQTLRLVFDVFVNTTELKSFLMSEYQCTRKLTFSAGVSIAHYKEPLPIVLHNAHKAEQTAKEQGGRDAFTLIASKGSGVTHTTTHKWTFAKGESSISVVDVMQDVWTKLRNGEINNRFFRTFADEFTLVANMDKKTEESYVLEIYQNEFRRLVKRNKTTNCTMSPNELSTWATDLFEIYQKSERSISCFLELLYILDFIARETAKPN